MDKTKQKFDAPSGLIFYFEKINPNEFKEPILSKAEWEEIAIHEPGKMFDYDNYLCGVHARMEHFKNNSNKPAIAIQSCPVRFSDKKLFMEAINKIEQKSNFDSWYTDRASMINHINNLNTEIPKPRSVSVGYSGESYSCSGCGRTVKLYGTVYGLDRLVCDECAH